MQRELSRPLASAPAMIIGIGSDLIDIRRIERTLARFGERHIPQRAKAHFPALPRNLPHEHP